MNGGRFHLTLLLVTALLPAMALALAGVVKLNEPILAAMFLQEVVGFPLTIGIPAVRLLAVVELALSLALTICITRSAVPAGAGFLLMGFFTGLLTRMSCIRQCVACGCWGSLMGAALQRSPWTQVFIDAALSCLLLTHILLLRAWRRRALIAVESLAPAHALAPAPGPENPPAAP